MSKRTGENDHNNESISRVLYRKCPNCRFAWSSRQAFLSDPGIEIIGYQVHFKHLAEGLFFFNHRCKGTLAIRAGEFKDLYHGPIFIKRATGSSDCPGFCLNKNILDPCPAECECAYVREIMQIIKLWPKSMVVSASQI
jgi:hypothetical protein